MAYIKFNISEKYYNFESSIEVFENLEEETSDRFEFIYPNYNFEKYLLPEKEINGSLRFTSSGFQKHYQTDIYEGLVINNIVYDSRIYLNNSGLRNSFNILLKNVNRVADNSTTYENTNDHKLLSAIMFKSDFPIMKSGEKYNEYLKPIFTARYSPNETKNYKTLNRKLDLNDIHTIDRIGQNDMVEGGKSISIGFEYSKEDKMNNNLFSLTMANVLRDKKNYDLPLKTTL